MIIDWYSFTAPCEIVALADVSASALANHAGRALGAYVGSTWGRLMDTVGTFDVGKGRAPYLVSFTAENITIFVSPNIENVLVEISGQGCEFLRRHNLLDDLMTVTCDRASRLDVAVDWITDVTPTQFCGTGYSARFASKGDFMSHTGHTVYVGSRKSERYARVYRYNEPHPRADKLRCEFVLRKKLARAYTRALVYDGLESVTAKLFQDFAFQHSLASNWQEMSPSSVTLPATPKTDDSTLIWLIESVSPAFKRLVDNGKIEDPVEFINTYFLSD